MPEKRLIHHGGQPIVEPPESGQTRQPSGFLSEQFAREEKSRDPKTEKIPAIRFRGFTDAWEQRKVNEIATEITRTDPESTAPVMMISAASGFIYQSETYAFDNAGPILLFSELCISGDFARHCQMRISHSDR